MKPAPLISIIIPAFNAGAVISQSLASARAQTCSDFEAIIVDDGSTDDTVARAKQFAEADARFTILPHANAGVSAARNAALEKARGNFIAFLDADDVWLPEKLSRQMERLKKNPAVNFIFTNYFIWDGEKNLGLRYSRPEKMPLKNLDRKLIFFCLFGISSVMVKRELILRAGHFDPEFSYAEDWDFWLRLSESGLRAEGIFEPLMRYRVWPGNVSKNDVRMARANVRVLEKALLRKKQNRAYRKSLQIARGQLEMAAAAPFIQTAPGKISRAVLKAWRHCPARSKWLFWYLGMISPDWLGGQKWRALVYQKILNKWRP